MLFPRILPLALAFAFSSPLLTTAAAATSQEYVPPASTSRQKARGATTPKQSRKTPVKPDFSVAPFLDQAPPPAPTPTFALFNDAIRLTQAKKYAEAEKTYRKLLKIDPNADAAWANLALLAGQNRARTGEAIGYLQKATRLAPRSAPFWAQLASLYSRAQRWDDAAAAAQKALALDKRNETAMANLAGARLQQKKFDLALPLLRNLRATHPADRQTEVSLIFALRQTGQLKEALTVARAAAIRLPNDVNAQLMLGDTAGQMGLYRDARNAYAAAYTQQPGNIAAGLSTAVASSLSGDRDEATTILQKLMERYPDDARAFFQMGYLTYTDPKQTVPERYKRAEALFHTATLRDPRNAQYIAYQAVAILVQGPDRYKEAESLFNAALQVAPPTSPFAAMAHLGLAHVREKDRKWEEASREYRAALEINPKEYSARRGLAGVLYASDKKDDAYREFATLVVQNPKDTTAATEMASLLVADKRFPQAAKAYETALARDSSLTSARVGLGQVHEIMKEPALAQKQYELALATDPAYAPAALSLATLLSEQNKDVQAAAVLEKAVEADPKNNSVRYQLGMTYSQMARYDDALKTLRALLLKKDDPRRVEYQLSPVRVLSAQKRYDEAIRDLRRLKAENPKEDRITYMLVAVLEAAGKADEAEPILKEIVARPVEQPEQGTEARLSLAQLQLRREEWLVAAENFEDVLRIQPANYAAFSGLRQSGTGLKDPERAIRFLEQLATGDPKEPDQAIVEVIRQLQDRNKASDKFREFTKRLVEKYPESRTALQTRALSLLRDTPDDARKSEAVELYRRLAALNPKDGDVRYQLGQVWESLNKKDEAVAAYRDALKADPRTQAAEAALRRLGVPVPTTSQLNASPAVSPPNAGKTVKAGEP